MNLKQSTLGFDKIYVINLKRREDRKLALLKAYPNLNFTFIEAVDGEQLDFNNLINSNKLNPYFLDPHGMISMGVFACALSHKKAWDQAILDGVENALFLEDDVFSPTPLIDENSQFTPFYQDILSEINNHDWDIIHLGKKSLIQRGMNIGKYLTVPKYNHSYEGAHAYAVKKDTIKTLSNTYLPVKYAADVYLEQYLNTHKVMVVRHSIIQQVNDLLESQNADSDTYYNKYREGDGDLGLSFDEEGKVFNRDIVYYIKHPKEILDRYVTIVFDQPKFGIQKFNPHPQELKFNNNFFGINELLLFLSQNLKEGDLHSMLEVYPHTGENTFFFGCSNIFSYIYYKNKLIGEDQFNQTHDLTWKDIEVAFNNNTYFFKNKLKKLDKKNHLSFVYYNLRNQDLNKFKNDLSSYSDVRFIGGSNYSIGEQVIQKMFKNKKIKTFKDNSWIVEI